MVTSPRDEIELMFELDKLERHAKEQLDACKKAREWYERNKTNNGLYPNQKLERAMQMAL